MIDEMMPYQPAGNKTGAAMRIDMVRTVLRIILQHENHAFLPDGALAQVFDKFAYRQIIVGHVGKGCG